MIYIETLFSIRIYMIVDIAMLFSMQRLVYIDIFYELTGFNRDLFIF